MTDREKLVKLIEVGRMCPEDGCPFEEEKCALCRYKEDADCDLSRLADHLVENGVFFLEDLSDLINEYYNAGLRDGFNRAIAVYGIKE